MDKQQNVIRPMSPDASVQFFRTEQDRYARLAKKAEVKLE
jgi:hypothetical protein